MGQDQRPKRWNGARARELLVEAKQSGESLSTFAQRRGIDPQRLYSWRRKLSARNVAESSTTSEAFVAVRIAPEASATRGVCFELMLGAGRIVRVAPDFDAVALRRLVEALEEGAR